MPPKSSPRPPVAAAMNGSPPRIATPSPSSPLGSPARQSKSGSCASGSPKGIARDPGVRRPPFLGSNFERKLSHSKKKKNRNCRAACLRFWKPRGILLRFRCPGVTRDAHATRNSFELDGAVTRQTAVDQMPGSVCQVSPRRIVVRGWGSFPCWVVKRTMRSNGPGLGQDTQCIVITRCSVFVWPNFLVY